MQENVRYAAVDLATLFARAAIRQYKKLDLQNFCFLAAGHEG
jgi:hypothetical protein